MKKLFAIASFCGIALFSCKKDSVDNQNDPSIKSDLSIEFDNIVGSQNLVLNTKTYTNNSSEEYTVSLLKYYISNIKLVNSEGTEYAIPQDSSYFLIDESDEESQSVKLKVPQGDYKSLTFTIGIDSLRNTKDISQRTGVLDPTTGANGMYWGWNSGYIFFKIEGSSPAAGMGGEFMYHIGGFGGYTSPTINNIKTVTLDLTAGGVPHVITGHHSNIHLMADISKLFEGPTTLSIAANSMVMFEDFSTTIANNYVRMFRHDHTENE